MKICICTTPIRPYPTDFPPLGSLAIIQSLRKIGEDPQFYNIDYFRHGHAAVTAYFRENQFDVVGISAVVSTAYTYTKYLSKLIREVSPHTVIVVGGNLAASAEILLRKCPIDFCVTGDGELIVRELIEALRERPLDRERFRSIKGLCFLDDRKEFCFTGYGEKPSADELEWPDYRILEKDGSLPYFITDNVAERVFGLTAPVEPGKRCATVQMAKGCVARCTFCHRWEKGFRVIPADRTTAHIRHLIDRYNVGYVLVADENFGADKKVTSEVAVRLGELGIKWQVAGVRVRTVTKETLQLWKDNGCLAVYFGIESGSDKILKVMEKNATLEQNINALKWTYEVGLNTIIQLVLGLPGEDDETIGETIEFLKKVTPYMKEWEGKVASQAISINYAQALPGTPLYEYARQKGLIGRTIDDEEQYLIKISDTDAYRSDHFINHSGLPLLKVLTWRFRILSEIDAHHFRRMYGDDATMSLPQIAWYYAKICVHKAYRRVIKTAIPHFGGAAQAAHASIEESGYFNVHSGIMFAPLYLNPLTRRIFYPLLATIMVLRNMHSPKRALDMVVEHARWSFASREREHASPDRSLRKLVSVLPSDPERKTDDLMTPLRLGR